MTYPPHPGWTTPPPPPPNDRPIRGRKVAAGIAWAALAQVVVIGLGVLAVFLLAQRGNGEDALLGIYLEVLLQILLFAGCLAFGIIWIARRDRGLGLGVLIGWAVSAIVFPVAGIGVCLAIVSQMSAS